MRRQLVTDDAPGVAGHEEALLAALGVIGQRAVGEAERVALVDRVHDAGRVQDVEPHRTHQDGDGRARFDSGSRVVQLDPAQLEHAPFADGGARTLPQRVSAAELDRVLVHDEARRRGGARAADGRVAELRVALAFPEALDHRR